MICMSPELFALPKFASRMGLKCQSCHVNPTGKGMRTPFGQIYGMDDITIPTWKESSFLSDFSSQITPNISIGIDMRTLLFSNAADGKSSTFQMQGDVYFSFALNKKVKIFMDKGLYSGFEIFAIAKVLPLKGYVKAGHFMPAYGTRTDDHTAFIRGGPFGGGPFQQQFAPLTAQGYLTGLLFGERSEDTGIELGFTPGVFTITAGLFNGNSGSGLNGIVGSLHKALALRADATFKTSLANVMIGGSYYSHPSAASGKPSFAGIFSAVSFAKRYTLNTEYDRVEVHAGGKSRVGYVLWNELNVLVSTGIDIKLGYEFYDPDVDVKNGSFSRGLVGAELFVLPGVELRPLYRFNVEEPTDVSNNEFQFLFHFFF
jgi:hypothetical protein